VPLLLVYASVTGTQDTLVNESSQNRVHICQTVNDLFLEGALCFDVGRGTRTDGEYVCTYVLAS
jgi:hypothetical protein